MVKLHEWQARYERKHEEHGARRRKSTVLSKFPSPIDVTNELLNDHWNLEGKKLQKRAAKLKESTDRSEKLVEAISYIRFFISNRLLPYIFSFPLRLILITQEDMDSIFQHKVHVHGHARIMKVAGKQHEHYLDQFIVKKVRYRDFTSISRSVRF